MTNCFTADFNKRWPHDKQNHLICGDQDLYFVTPFPKLNYLYIFELKRNRSIQAYHGVKCDTFSQFPKFKTNLAAHV